MNDPAALRRQAMQNAEDMQFFLRDLSQWETQMKAKDQGILHNPPGKSDIVGDELPIRNKKDVTSDSKDDMNGQSKSVMQSTSGKANIISALDNNSWNRNDIEMECNKVIEEVGNSEIDPMEEDTEDSDEVEEENDELDEQELKRCKQRAMTEKDKGNQFYRAEKYDEAIMCYTMAFQLDPTNPILPSNRAMALLKKEQYGAAAEDCQMAIELDPTYVKPYQRRAAARKGLHMYSLAKEDLLMVLKLEPNNIEAKKELPVIEKFLQDKTQTTQLKLNKIAGQVFPAEKSIDLQSKKPLKRIHIEEINEEPKKEEIKKIDKSLNSSPRNYDVERVEPSSSLPDKLETDKVKNLALNLPNVPVAPKSAFQFLADFRKLKTFPELLYAYIKQIPCTNYPYIFQHCLESDILSQLILVYHSFYMWKDDDVYDPLYHLADTKRFSMLKLFFSTKDKEILRELFEYMKKVKARPEKELNLLIQAYDCC